MGFFSTNSCIVIFRLFIGVFIICGPASYAQSVILHEPIKELRLPDSALFFLADSGSIFSLTDVIENKNWSPVTRQIRKSAGITYWAKFTLTNSLPVSQQLVCYPGRSMRVNLYEPNGLGKNYTLRKNGRYVAYGDKDIQGFINYGNYVRLNVPADTTVTYYFSSYFDKEFFIEPTFWFELYDREEFYSSQYFINLLAILFIGGMLVMALYTALLAVSLRDPMYYVYVGFIVSGMLFYAYYHGFTIEWLWPNMPNWDVYSFLFILGFTFFFWLEFARKYLDTKQNMPGWDRFLQFMAWFSFAPGILGGIDMIFDLGPHFLRTIQQAQNVQTLIILVIIIILGIRAIWIRVQSSQFFLLANLAVLLGSIILSLRFLGVIPLTTITEYSGKFGFFLQMILFSLGLGDKINKMKQELIHKDLMAQLAEKEKEREILNVIREKNKELETRLKVRSMLADERKLEIEEKARQLQEQNDELTRVNAFKDKLFSIVGHDLRNPLGSLKGMLDLIHQGLIDKEEFLQITQHMRRSVTSSLDMLNNLLMWGLQQMDSLQYRPQTFSLREVVQDCLDLHTPQAQIKEISIHLKNSDQFFVFADREMIHLVIRNLLSNAIKFTPNGGQVFIALRKVEGEIWVIVEDTGVGMSQEKLEKLFDKSLESTFGTQSEKGTGLGLKLCDEFVRKNKGTLQVKSTLGEGTTLSFSLPLAIE